MDVKTKPKIGQQLFSLNIGNAARRSPQVLTPCVVVQAGRKFFTVEISGVYKHKVQFKIEDWHQKTDFSADCVLYESEQEYADEKESLVLCLKIKKAFEWNANRNFTLEKLRQIDKIISPCS